MLYGIEKRAQFNLVQQMLLVFFSLNYFLNFFFKFNFTSKGEIVFAGNENVSSKVRKTTKPWANINLDCIFFCFLKYIRVSYKTDISTMIALLTSKKKWNMKKPELIISVAGGAKLKINNKLKETFCKGILKAATTTSKTIMISLFLNQSLKTILQKDAWIISGGSHTGCMKLVGEAFRKNSLSIDPSLKIPVLGVSNWCTVANYETLIRPNVSLINGLR
jgi:hypothetical protein